MVLRDRLVHANERPAELVEGREGLAVCAAVNRSAADLSRCRRISDFFSRSFQTFIVQGA